ncbi:MAG: acyltransferase [Henriciella sp.]
MDRDRLHVLDGWRGCAILLLLVGHFLHPAWMNTGRAGVEFFFVLSGRLMGEILFVHGAELRGWAHRRVARLVPALWVFLAIVAIAGVSGPGLSVSAGEIAAAAGFYINYSHGLSAIPQLQHIWSLCVEAHCYLLLAAVAWLMRDKSIRQIGLVLIALALVMMAWGAFQFVLLERGYHDVYWRSDVRGASIIIASGVYLLARDFRSPWIFAFAVPLGFALQAEAVPDVIKYTLGTGALALAVATAPTAHRIVRSALSLKALSWFGLTSYSVYIWQQPFAHSGMHWTLGILLALACGAVSYYVVETPLRRAYMAALSRGQASNI